MKFLSKNREICRSVFGVIAVIFGTPSSLGADPLFTDAQISVADRPVYDGGWAHFVGGGVAVFDCNGDARPDAFVAGGSNPAALLINESVVGGSIRMVPRTIAPLIRVVGAYPLDMNDDGHDDLFILRNGANRLWLGDGACGFEDATARYGLPQDTRWSTAFAATWERDAQLPTLAIGNYVDATDPDGPFGTCDTNWLIRPDGATYGDPTALDPGFCPLSMLISDWQRTGTPMLRISNDRQYYVRDGYEQMWSLDPVRQLGAADGWDPLRLWGMGIASRDISGDGLPEVMLTSMGDQMLMANTGDGFATVPFTTGTFAQRPHTGGDGRPSTGWHAEFADVNNDARPDLFIAKGNVDQMPDMAMQDPNNLLIQGSDGQFTEMAASAGVAAVTRGRGASLADLNADGLLDLIVVNRRAPLDVWQNVTPDAGNWLGITLRQPAPNIRAIGALVEVRTGDTLQTQELTIGGGHVSGRLGPLHFGLGTAATAEVRVIWPDGRTGDWQTVTANQAMMLHP